MHECEQQNQEEVFRGTPRANSHVDGERGKRSSSTKRALSAQRQTTSKFKSDI